MWPFKRKKPLVYEVEKPFESVICIPGDWKDRSDFVVSIVAASNGEYVCAGNIIMNAKKQTHYTIEFCEHDDRMRESFRYAGSVTGVSEEFLNKVEEHKHVIYISGTAGNLKGAECISHAAEAILKSGGIGIKIETAGKAFEKHKWDEFLKDFDEANLYEMYVLDSIVDENGTVFSCGMQNLGLKDTIVSGVPFQEAVDLISIFGYYQIVDKPRIMNMQTFSRSFDAPKFRIVDEPNSTYKGQLFENPFGMWRLIRE